MTCFITHFGFLIHDLKLCPEYYYAIHDIVGYATMSYCRLYAFFYLIYAEYDNDCWKKSKILIFNQKMPLDYINTTDRVHFHFHYFFFFKAKTTTTNNNVT